MDNSTNPMVINNHENAFSFKKEYSFYFYLLSVFITFIGNSISFIVCGKYSLDLFGLASVFGGLLLLEQFKSLILSSYSGYLANKFSPKKIAVYCDLICFFITLVCGILANMGHLKVSIVASMFFLNLVKPFYNTSIFSLVRLIANESQLFQLNSRTAVAQQLGCFIGLALAAILIARISVSNLLLIDSLSFLFSAISLTFCEEIKKFAKLNTGEVRTKILFSFQEIKSKMNGYISIIKSNQRILYFSIMIGIQANLIVAYNTCLFKLISVRFPNHPDYLSYLEIAYSLAIIFISLGIEKFKFLKFCLSNIKLLFLVQTFIFTLFSINFPFNLVLFFVTIYGVLNSLIFPVLFTEFYKVIPMDFIGSAGGLKGTLQAVTAIPILLITGLITDFFNLNYSYIFIASFGLLLIFLTLTIEKINEQK